MAGSVTGAETESIVKMKNGSKTDLEVTVKPSGTGRHTLEIKVLDRVVVSKEFECKPGNASFPSNCNVQLPCIYIGTLI